jgi:hypothetical protein
MQACSIASASLGFFIASCSGSEVFITLILVCRVAALLLGVVVVDK